MSDLKEYIIQLITTNHDSFWKLNHEQLIQLAAEKHTDRVDYLWRLAPKAQYKLHCTDEVDYSIVCDQWDSWDNTDEAEFQREIAALKNSMQASDS